jgi:hypothetical protein
MPLKPIHQFAAKHTGFIFLIGGMEHATKALRRGDGFEDSTEGLQELARRARALADAIEFRLEKESEQ